MKPWLSVTVSASAIAIATGSLTAQRGGVFRESRDHPAIRYTDGTPRDAVSDMNTALRTGNTQLVFDPTTGYLHSVLEALNVPVTPYGAKELRAEWAQK